MESVDEKSFQEALSAICSQEGFQHASTSQIKDMAQTANNREFIANYMGITTKKKKCILLKTTGVVKVRDVVISQEKTFAAKLTRAREPVEISCSRLCVGKLSEDVVTVWYDDRRSGKNKRLERILGIPAGGNALFCKKEGDLTLEEFLDCEKILKSIFDLK